MNLKLTKKLRVTVFSPTSGEAVDMLIRIKFLIQDC